MMTAFGRYTKCNSPLSTGYHHELLWGQCECYLICVLLSVIGILSIIANDILVKGNSHQLTTEYSLQLCHLIKMFFMISRAISFTGISFFHSPGRLHNLFCSSVIIQRINHSTIFIVFISHNISYCNDLHIFRERV